VEALTELLGQEELTAAIDTLSHLLHEEKLTAAVEALTREVRHLAMIVDEVREEIAWSVRNPQGADGEIWRSSLSASHVEELLEPESRPAKSSVEPSPAAQKPLFQ
jgi:hypothetical protein